MYANYLLDSYKKAQNYVQDKQIAADLKVTQSRICEMRQGKRYISDKEAVFLAENANIDPKEALLGVHADRQDNPKIKQMWADIAKKLKGQNYQLYSIGLTAFAFSIFPVNDVLHECALCTLC
ncbi:DUF3693 domain-containing protein [Photobacterium kishitanii]|uniref:DUF3693 domain-containing protein n=1 Tax=Photobacterium kishitanii TaxID=318456 RepID=UPI0027394286|nr:DUF3693 domain-containing protein [Photobacterium kishitanii]